MRVQVNTVVTVNYQMFSTDGVLIDENQAPMDYLHGGYDQILPAVEADLEGCVVGDKVSVELTPEQAFGEHDPELVFAEDLRLLPEDVQVGMVFETRDEDNEETTLHRVIEVDMQTGKVVLDANHPLAGLDLRFVAEVVAIRAASAAEISAVSGD